MLPFDNENETSFSYVIISYFKWSLDTFSKFYGAIETPDLWLKASFSCSRHLMAPRQILEPPIQSCSHLPKPALYRAIPIVQDRHGRVIKPHTRAAVIGHHGEIHELTAVISVAILQRAIQLKTTASGHFGVNGYDFCWLGLIKRVFYLVGGHLVWLDRFRSLSPSLSLSLSLSLSRSPTISLSHPLFYIFLSFSRWSISSFPYFEIHSLFPCAIFTPFVCPLCINLYHPISWIFL